MSIPQEESTAQQAASEEQPSPAGEAEQQTQESSDPGQSVSADESNSIPEKFVGKSPAEIIQAYRELERERGRLASDLGNTRKERESLEERFRGLERESMKYSQPAQAQQQSQSEDLDPVSVFDAEFDEDPKAAIKKALSMQRDATKRNSEEQIQESRRKEAHDWYNKQKQENQDYARREKLMESAVQQFGSLIHPQHRNSVEVLKVLDLISRGMDVSYYEKQAVDKAQKGGLSMREEKRRAQSESANSSSGEKSVNMKDLSLAEMEKLFGVADK